MATPTEKLLAACRREIEHLRAAIQTCRDEGDTEGKPFQWLQEDLEEYLKMEAKLLAKIAKSQKASGRAKARRIAMESIGMVRNKDGSWE